MKKVIVGFIVLILLVSCASISEYRRTYRQELQQRDEELFGPPKPLDDTGLALLLGLYAFSLAKNPPEYPFYYSYSPYLFLPFYPYDSFHDLMVYESMLRSINRAETFKLTFEVERILDELRREAAKLKRERENDLDFLNQIPPKTPAAKIKD